MSLCGDEGERREGGEGSTAGGPWSPGPEDKLVYFNSVYGTTADTNRNRALGRGPSSGNLQMRLQT